MTYIYDTTYEREDHEGNVVASVEARFYYTWTPGTPARIRYDEHDHPAWPDEVEITDIKIETWSHGLGKNAVYEWTKVYDRDLRETLDNWAELNLRDALIENASEAEAAAEDGAADRAYDEARDRQLEEPT